MPFIKTKRTKPRTGRLGRHAMKKLREDVFARDGFRCQHLLLHHGRQIVIPGGAPIDIYYPCHKPVTWETGHLCHIVSRGAGGHDTAENTYCGCADCHLQFHSYGPSGRKPCPSKNQ